MRIEDFQAVVPDLIWDQRYWVGTCPVCRQHTLRIAIYQDGVIEPNCANCGVTQILAAVDRLQEKNGTNGHQPNGASVSPFVVSVFRRPSFAVPTELASEALHGLAGDVVRTIDPHTESHPAAVLATFLVGVGCLIGTKPHIYRDGSRQTTNEFAMLVGRSAVGRKGTAQRRVDEILKCIKDSNSTKFLSCPREREGVEIRDKSLYEGLRLSGLGSGEALIEALANEEDDRRRIIIETEFSKCLKIMRREGSILSETLRSAWDGDVLSNRTKGKHNVAVDTHIAILGHITDAELKAEMANVSLFNGFANRFLWIACGRSKSLPRGGGKTPIEGLIQRVQAAIDLSRHYEQVEFNEPVMDAWDKGGIYDLLNIDRPGVMGAIISRAAAHVTRLAVIYMCLDMEAQVNEDHLLAALALWDYSLASAESVFGRSTGDDTADRIDEALCEVAPGGLDRTQIRDLFSRNAKAGQIPNALALLEQLGRAHMSKVETDGRPIEIWSATSPATSERHTTKDLNDKSPLQRARTLFGRDKETQ